MNKNKIDFIGVGVQKAATTWIGKALEAHPEILFSSLKGGKELDFFNKNYQKGINWYLEQFPPFEKGKVRGEFSPQYFLDKRVPRRIKSHFPNVKILISLRNPTDVIYSLFWSYKKIIRKNINKNFSFDSVDHRQGLYYSRLKQFYDLFPRSNLLIILYRDIQQSPELAIKKIYKFLEVDYSFTPQTLEKKINYAVIPRFNYIKLACASFLNTLDLAGLNFISSLIGKNRQLSMLYRLINNKKYTYPVMSKETRLKLTNYFKKDIQKSAKLIRCDLSHWLIP